MEDKHWEKNEQKTNTVDKHTEMDEQKINTINTERSMNKRQIQQTNTETRMNKRQTQRKGRTKDKHREKNEQKTTTVDKHTEMDEKKINTINTERSKNKRQIQKTNTETRMNKRQTQREGWTKDKHNRQGPERRMNKRQTQDEQRKNWGGAAPPHRKPGYAGAATATVEATRHQSRCNMLPLLTRTEGQTKDKGWMNKVRQTDSRSGTRRWGVGRGLGGWGGLGLVQWWCRHYQSLWSNQR